MSNHYINYIISKITIKIDKEEMLSSSVKVKSKYTHYIKDSNDINICIANQTIKPKDDIKLYDLNKWDEEHLYPNKQLKSLQIEQRISSFFNSSSLDQLKFNNQIVDKMATIKKFQDYKCIQDLRKSIQQKISNVIAKNIKINYKNFDYDTFRQTSSLTKSNIDTHINDLLKTRNEIQLRMKGSKKKGSLHIDSINENDEIKISNQTFKMNHLSIEGNFEKVFSNEYYKAIIKSKKTNEKTYHHELNDILTKLQSKQKQMAMLQNEQKELHTENEAQRMRYLECKEAANIIEKEYIKSAPQNQSNYKGVQYVKLQTLNNQLSVIEKEYIDTQGTNQLRLEEIKKNISELKTEITSLYKYKEHNLKCLIAYYLELLSKGIDVREGGLVWVIVLLSELGVNLTQNNFPDFLDYISIKYLIEYSKKALQLKQLKQVMRLLKIKYKKQITMNNTTASHFAINSEESTAFNRTMLLFEKKVFQIESNLPAHILIKEKQQEKNELMMRKFQVRFGVEESNGNQTDRTKKSEFNTNKESYINETLNKISNQSIHDLTILRNMIMKNENEIHSMKAKYLEYFKSKHELNKSKGISECIRYDLIFSALFGNYAIV